MLTLSQRQAVTPFQAKVYDALLQVQAGHVTTYQDLGKAIECRSSQAIGQALRRNPFAPEIPCHRVIQKNGSLGGFGGSWEKASDKHKLLEAEGVHFTQNAKGEWKVDPNCIYQFN